LGVIIEELLSVIHGNKELLVDVEGSAGGGVSLSRQEVGRKERGLKCKMSNC
jgi:hypothetical protein